MINYDVCNQMLLIHICFVVIICIVIILLIGIIFLLLKWFKIFTKAMAKKSFFILTIGCIVISLFYTIPPTIDIIQKDYAIKENIVLCKEEDFSTKFISQQFQLVFIDNNAEEIELFNFMMSKDDLIEKELNGYIIYSKYSKICIAYFDY